MLPVTSVDEWGNTCIIKDAVNLRVVEKIGKLISAGGYGLAGQAGFVMTGKELKETVIPGTLTKAYEVGRFIREAREAGETQMVKKLAEKIGAYILQKERSCRWKMRIEKDITGEQLQYAA